MCVALELRAEDAVKVFRITAGPFDVGMAKELRPGNIVVLFPYRVNSNRYVACGVWGG